MASYTLQCDLIGSTVTLTWSGGTPSPGNGSFASPYQFQGNDTITFQNVHTDSASFSISNSFISNNNFTVPALSSVQRTVVNQIMSGTGLIQCTIDDGGGPPV